MTSRRHDGESARRPATLRPLIGNQRRYVHAERFSESSYIVPMAYRFEAELDIGRFRAAIDGVFARHDALRTDFVLAEGAYHARVHEDVRYAFHQLAFDADDFEAFRARALPIVFAPVALDDRRALFRVILAGIGPGRWRFCFALHHSLTDGASRNQFFREVVDLYEGRTLEPARSFYLGGAAPSLEALAASEAHWRDWAAAGPLQLQDAPDLETTEADGPDTAMAVRELPLSGGAVRDAARTIGASKFGLMSAAYAIGLSARLDASDVLMCFQSAGRSGLGADMRAIGPYSNTLPLRVRVGPETPFAEIAARATAATREGLAHEALPFDALRSVARFDSDFVINAFPSEAPFDGAAIRGARREFLDRKTEFAFNLLWSEDDGRLTARIFYDPRRRAPDRTRAFLELTARLFEAGLATPERSAAELLAEVRMPPPRPAAAPAAAVEPGGADALTAPFLAHAAARPNAPAVVTRDGAVSYGALAAAARRVARDLAALGVGAGARAAIELERGPDLPAAMIGAALSGAAFAVLDPSLPEPRRAAMRAALRPAATISAAAGGGVSVTAVDGAAAPPAAPAPADPNAPVYFLFTSGTTGAPRGFGHPAQALARFVAWEIAALELGPEDRVTMLSGLGHDPLMRDVFTPLTAGAAIVAPTQADFDDPAALRALFAATGATVAHLTPPMGRLLAMGAPDGALRGLKAVIWGGDALTGALAARVFALAPGARQINLYGATETPQAALTHEIDRDAPPWRRAPLGTPPDWMRVDILGPDGAPCGVGETGELTVAFPFQVTRLGPDGAVAERFSRHRTGDRAVFAPDGAALFVGRRDDQVKIRGHRVELDEVARAAQAAAGGAQAVALAPGEGDARRLVCFVETGAGALDAEALRRAMARALPAHMVPAKLTLLERLPLTPNGKIDRAALAAAAAPPPPAPARARRAPPPEGATARIAEVIARGDPDHLRADVTVAQRGADSLAVVETRLELEALVGALPANWVDMTAAELADLAARRDHAPAAPGPFKTRWVETYLPLRALATVLIVFAHFEAIWTGGGLTSALLVIAGFTFALSSGPASWGPRGPEKLWATLGYAALATLAVASIFTAHALYKGYAHHPANLLFASNWLSYHERPYDDGRLVWFWYIHCYLQIFLALGLALRVGALRRAAEAAPLQTALAGYLALELIAHLTRAAATGELSGSPQYGPSYYWPTTHAPSVALGMVIGLARTPRDRLAAFGAFALHALLSHMAFDDRSLAPLAIGALLLLATARLPLPQILVAPVTTISAASLFIYLLHWPLAHLLHRFGETPPAVTALLTIALALAVWAASRRVAEPAARAIARAAWSAARGGAGLGRAQAAAKSSADSA